MTDKIFSDSRQNELDLTKIKGFHQAPFIGVIGATVPDEEYELRQGVNIGYRLREFIDDKKGSIFTGGVEGIGSDTYAGVLKYCFHRAVKEGRMPQDRFFVLVPHTITFPVNFGTDNPPAGLKSPQAQQIVSTPFNPPDSYGILSEVFSNELDVARAGKDMYERRINLAELADYLVMVNGGPGTFHEALEGLKRNKPLIVAGYTGGASRTFTLLNRQNGASVAKQLKLDLNSINLDLIKVVWSESRVIGELEKLL